MASDDPMAPDYVQSHPTNPKALAGFVFSVVGVLLLYPPLSVLGIVFGFLAGSGLDRQVDTSGYHFMLGAKVIGIVGLIVAGVVLLFDLTRHVQAPGFT